MIRSFIKNIRDRLRNLIKPGKKKESPSEEAQSSDFLNIPGTVQKENLRRRKKSPAAPNKGKPDIQANKKWDISQFEVPPADGMTRFHDFDLPPQIMRAIADLNFRYCTPIQAMILPGTLAGKDASGRAQTGTGKTAAFLITILTHLLHNPIMDKRIAGAPRALIIAPTRELILQITQDAFKLSAYCQFKIVSIFGGMDYQKQRMQIERKVDIIVATPGRLIDFIEHREMHLDRVEIMVIDEADRMLDMGFMPQVRRIINSTPHKDKRQTLLFSATLTPDIVRLSSQWTRNAVTVESEPEQIEVKSVEQIVYIVTIKEKYALLYNIITVQNLTRVLIFCNRRDETRRLAELLERYNINCAVLSGEIAQNKRVRTLDDFRAGKILALVATDVAARGLHIEGVSHVINYTLPLDPEGYVHRIGRTGRAGATGISISFACEEDSFQIPVIEKFLGHGLQCTHPPDEWLILPPPPVQPPKPNSQKPKRFRSVRRKD